MKNNLLLVHIPVM